MKKVISVKNVFMVQALPAEGERGLVAGNYDGTMTVAELRKEVKERNSVSGGMIGLGGTRALSNEITVEDDHAVVISGQRETGDIRIEPLEESRLLSFAQMAPTDVEGVSVRRSFDEVSAEGSQETYEINQGGAFRVLLDALGKVSSSVVHITADVQYIKTRAVCPTIEGRSEKLSPAADLKTMILGGPVEKNGETVNVEPQVIKEQTFESPQRITMVGMITGAEMAENVPLKGLHIHCKYGHVLDLGRLANVEVVQTPIADTYALLPTDSEEKEWHRLLRESDLESVIRIQQWYKEVF